MKKPHVKRRLVTRSLLQQALRLATPVIFAYLSAAIFVNVDFIMVGQLGSNAMAAVGLGGWIFLILFLTFNAFEVGVQVMVARRFGEKNFKTAGKIFSVTLTTGTIIGLIGTVIVMLLAPWCVHATPEIESLATGFLRYRMAGFLFALIMFSSTGFFNGIGKPLIPMIAQILGNGLNIFLNWLLIYGNWGFPKMGVNGAGLASTMALVIGCLIIFIGLARHKYRRKYQYRWPVRLDPAILRRLFGIASPIAMQALLINGGFLTFIYINKTIDILAVSLSQTIIFITLLSFLPVVGIGVAAATMTGQYLGAGQRGRARRAGWVTVGMGLGVMTFSGLIYFFLGEHLLWIYIQDAAHIKSAFVEQGALVLKIMAVFQLFDAVGVILARILQSAGFARFVMVVEVSFFWLLFLPLAYILGVTLKFGVIGAWSAFAVYLISYATVMVVKYYRGNWMDRKI